MPSSAAGCACGSGDAGPTAREVCGAMWHNLSKQQTDVQGLMLAARQQRWHLPRARGPPFRLRTVEVMRLVSCCGLIGGLPGVNRRSSCRERITQAWAI